MGTLDGEVKELSKPESEEMAREGRMWLLQDARNYLLDVLDIIDFPKMLPGEREKLEAAREVLASLKLVEEER